MAACLLSALPKIQILETRSICDVLKHKQAGTWFTFDLDNALVKTPKQFGSDQWFRWRVNLAKENKESFERALNDWTAIQLLTPLVPVEERTVDVVKELQKECFPVFAITSRGMRLGDRTVEQLDAVGIHLKINAVRDEEIFWPRGLDNANREHVLYERGIVFTAGQNKGLALRKFFEYIPEKERPSRIVYLDDSLPHCEAVAEACNKLGIDCIAYHYRNLDIWVSEFNPQAAKIDLENFKRAADPVPASSFKVTPVNSWMDYN